MISAYWERRIGLDNLYADTLRNMAAKLGATTVRNMNKGQLADFIIRTESGYDQIKYVNDCIFAGKRGEGRRLYLG